MGQSVQDNSFSNLQLEWSNISHNYLFCHVIKSSCHVALNHLLQIWNAHFYCLNNAQDKHSTLKGTNTKCIEGTLVYLKMQCASTSQFSLPLFFTPRHHATVVLYSSYIMKLACDKTLQAEFGHISCSSCSAFLTLKWIIFPLYLTINIQCIIIKVDNQYIIITPAFILLHVAV